MIDGGDMIVGLYNLPAINTYETKISESIKIKRAFVGDKELILEFVRDHFYKNWVYEVEHSLMQEVSKCFIATENGKLIGFACYDGAARGFFGPIGIAPNRQKENIGKALLLRTLHAMREYGYAYAVIGWVSEAEMFYRKIVGAEFIKNGNPENSVYSNLISL